MPEYFQLILVGYQIFYPSLYYFVQLGKELVMSLVGKVIFKVNHAFTEVSNITKIIYIAGALGKVVVVFI